MTDDWAFRYAEDFALGAVVDLLDTLIEASAAAVPGCTTGIYANGLRSLGDSAAQAAADLEIMLQQRAATHQAVA